MNTDVEITISIHKGENFPVKIDEQIILKASLESLTGTTDPVSLSTNSPEFATEINWQADRKEFRRCRISRTPIKLDCYTVKQNGSESFLGRVILPLTSLLEGYEAEPTWYKLLCMPTGPNQTVPKILIGMSLSKLSSEDTEEDNEEEQYEMSEIQSNMPDSSSETTEISGNENLNGNNGTIEEYHCDSAFKNSDYTEEHDGHPLKAEHYTSTNVYQENISGESEPVNDIILEAISLAGNDGEHISNAVSEMAPSPEDDQMYSERQYDTDEEMSGCEQDCVNESEISESSRDAVPEYEDNHGYEEGELNNNGSEREDEDERQSEISEDESDDTGEGSDNDEHHQTPSQGNVDMNSSIECVELLSGIKRNESENPGRPDTDDDQELIGEMVEEQEEEDVDLYEDLDEDLSTECSEGSIDEENEVSMDEDNEGSIDEDNDECAMSDSDSQVTIPFVNELREHSDHLDAVHINEPVAVASVNKIQSDPAVAESQISLIEPSNESISNNKETKNILHGLETRKNIREELRRMSIDRMPQKLVDKESSVCGKRPLEISPTAEPGVNEQDQQPSVSKRQKTADNLEFSIANVSKLEEFSKLNKQMDQSTTAAKILAMSVDSTPLKGKCVPIRRNNLVGPKISAELNEDEGYFQIGPTNADDLRVYHFSVTIVCARNLDKALAADFTPSLRTEFTLDYELLGCPIRTDVFKSLRNPELLAEKGTACIHSSPTFLSNYFQQHSLLPVNLMCGEIRLAGCVVDISKLTSIDTKECISIKENYDMLTDAVATNPTSPIVGFNVELSYVRTNYTKPRQKNNISLASTSRYPKYSFEENSSSDDSDVDFDTLLGQRKHLKFNRDRRKARKIMKYEKADMLYNASILVEEWKEKQKKIFMKEWSQREKVLHKHLATEWSETCKVFHSTLEKKLKECDTLQEKLTTSVQQITQREATLAEKETRIQQLDKDLSRTAMVNGGHQGLMAAENIPTQLQDKVRSLEKKIDTAERTIQEQTNEILSLTRKLVVKEDIRILRKDESKLTEDLESALEQKQYYKTKWLEAIQDLHRMHTETQNAKPSYSRTCDNEQENSSVPMLSSRIKNLLEERKLLTGNNVSSKHPSVETLNQKIRQIIDTCDG